MEKLGSKEKKDARGRRAFWMIHLMALLIFFSESRAIECFIQVFLLVISIGVIYGNIRNWILIALIILVPYIFIQSLQVIIFIGKYFRISDDDIGLRSIEKNLSFVYKKVCCTRNSRP